MNKLLIIGATFLTSSLICSSVFAGPLAVPNNFAAGTPAVAAEVNANFAETEAQVTDNANGIGANTTAIGTNTTAISGLQSSTCPSDMTLVGNFCIDTYEASLHDAATGGTQIPASTCDITGSNCMMGAATSIFAQSSATTIPNAATWFQALQACANVGKRLPTNAEWTTAAAGANALMASVTGSGGTSDCQIAGDTLANFRAPTATNNCTSAYGVVDMIGNAGEWTADWVQGADTASGASNSIDGNHSAAFGGDAVDDVVIAANNTGGGLFPAAIFRGGQANEGAGAGEFAIGFNAPPTFTGDSNTIINGTGTTGLGFRCAANL